MKKTGRAVPQTIMVPFCAEKEIPVSPQKEHRATIAGLMLPAWFGGVQTGRIMYTVDAEAFDGGLYDDDENKETHIKDQILYIPLNYNMTSGNELRFEVSGSLPEGDEARIVESGISAALTFKAGIPKTEETQEQVPLLEQLAARIAEEVGRAKQAEQANAAEIAEEQERATATEQQLTADLATEAQAREQGDSAKAAAIAQETIRATVAEEGLASCLEAETQRAQDAEAAIQASIPTAPGDIGAQPAGDYALQSVLLAEAQTRATEDNVNAAAITAEQQRATAAEQATANDLAAETQRAKTAEQANAQAIADEAEARTLGDINNTQALADETQAREDSEADNAAAIAAETTRATAAEQANTAAVAAEATRATEEESRIEGLIPTKPEDIGAQVAGNYQAEGNYQVAGDYATNAALADEATTRAAADAALQAAVDGIVIPTLPENLATTEQLAEVAASIPTTPAQIGAQPAGEYVLSADLDAETTARAEGDATNAAAIADEATRAGQAEATKLDKDFTDFLLTDAAVIAEEEAVSLQFGGTTPADGTTSSFSVALPIASDTMAGIMPKESFAAITALQQEVASIAGGRWIGQNFATKAALDAFTVPSTAHANDFCYVLADEDHGGVRTVYALAGDPLAFAYSHDDSGQEIGGATNDALGLFMGSESDGQVFIEQDYTGSVNGWADLKATVGNNTSAIGQNAAAIALKASNADLAAEAARAIGAEALKLNKSFVQDAGRQGLVYALLAGASATAVNILAPLLNPATGTLNTTNGISIPGADESSAGAMTAAQVQQLNAAATTAALAAEVTARQQGDAAVQAMIPTTPGAIGAQAEGDYATNTDLQSAIDGIEIPPLPENLATTEQLAAVEAKIPKTYADIGAQIAGDYATNYDLQTYYQEKISDLVYFITGTSISIRPEGATLTFNRQNMKGNTPPNLTLTLGVVNAALPIPGLMSSAMLVQLNATATAAALGDEITRATAAEAAVRALIPTTPGDIGAQAAGDYALNSALAAVQAMIPTTPGQIGAQAAGSYATTAALTDEATARINGDALKANAADVYTKTQADTLLSAKASIAALAGKQDTLTSSGSYTVGTLTANTAIYAPAIYLTGA